MAECDFHGDFAACDCPAMTESVDYLLVATGPGPDRNNGGDLLWEQKVAVKQMWEVAAEAIRSLASASKSP